MSAPKIRELVVTHQEFITPNMIRVTLGGAEISSIPEKHEGGYVKLIYPKADGRDMRTYTIRHQRVNEIDLDFVAHQDGGPASSWAMNAKPGDAILVGGPGPAKLPSTTADWHIFAGDMTALPAISVNLESLADDAKGYAVIEVMSEQDIQPVKSPAGVEVKWVINPNPGIDSEFLYNHIKDLPWLEGEAAAWAACEFSSMKVLRQYFKVEKAISKENLYLSSYWKLGINEEEHKVVKRQDAEAIS